MRQSKLLVKFREVDMMRQSKLLVKFREVDMRFTRLGAVNIIVLLIGIALLWFSLFADWATVLKAIGFPVSKLYGQRGQADLAMFRKLGAIMAVFLVASQVVLWRYPHAVTILAKGIEAIRAVAAQIPGLTAVFLALVVLVKTVLQLSLYLIGYRAYAGDDFSRALQADQWLQYETTNLGWEGWLNLGASMAALPRLSLRPWFGSP